MIQSNKIPDSVMNVITEILKPYGATLNDLASLIAPEENDAVSVDNRGLCDVRTAASYLGVHPYTIRRFIKRGTIRANKATPGTGGKFFISFAELDKVVTGNVRSNG